LGNGVDPMDVSETYGTDALRYFLSTNAAPGQDLRYETEKVESSWNFINKLWNIARFIDMNVEDANDHFDQSDLTLFDKWILTRLNQVITECDINYEKYEFGEVSRALYNFIWDEFASWYVEIAKLALKDNRKANTERVLIYVLKQILKLLHPFMPFVTERLYQSILKEETIVTTSWPVVSEIHSESSLKDMQIITEMIIKVRQLRQEMNIVPSKPLTIEIITKDLFVKENEAMLAHFLRSGELLINSNPTLKAETILVTGSGFELHILKRDIISEAEEKQKLEKELETLEKELTRVKNMLSNPNFLNKAKPEKVLEEQQKLENYQSQYDAIKKRMA
jgi:valyl-tRNA synthetase